MRARDVMTSPVVTVGPEVEVSEIARILMERRISAVPVVGDTGELLGIVSEGDLMRHADVGEHIEQPWWLRIAREPASFAARYTREHGRFAREVMTRDVVTVSGSATLAEIATLLEEHNIKRVPVIDDGAVVGIVSRANLLHGLGTARQVPQRSASDQKLRDALRDGVTEAGIYAPFVNIVVDGGVAHLWGAVGASEVRDALVVVAENTPGIESVENHLHVLDPRVQAAMGGGV